MQYRKRSFLLLITLVLGCCICVQMCVCAEETAGWTYGTVTYPAKMNFYLHEGTIEYWFKLEEPLPFSHKWAYYFAPVAVRTPQTKILFSFTGQGIYLSWNLLQGEKSTAFRPRIDWVRKVNREKDLPAADVWHHIAYAWRGKETWMVYDGKQVRGIGRAVQGLPKVLPQTGHIQLGSSNAPVTVDELCISSRARLPEEIIERMGGEIAEDIDTLLLDHFAEIVPANDMRETVAAYVSGLSGEHGGQVEGACRMVPGRFGTGMALFTPAP